MASEPVRVWVATDENNDQYVYREKPWWDKCLWSSDNEFDGFSPEMGIRVPPGECREFVMIPADQYRQPNAELSPVERVKLIATLAVNLSAQGDYNTFADACADAEKFIAAANKIESEAKQ